MLKQTWLPAEKKLHSTSNALRSDPSGISGRRLKAILLAFFLGSFGAHKFYLRRPVQGLIYLTFCWTFVPTIAGIIESINYFSISNEAFEAKYGLFSRTN